jgi:hypothetical protein
LAHGVFRSGGGKIEGGDLFRADFSGFAMKFPRKALKPCADPVNPLFYQNAPSNSRF